MLISLNNKTYLYIKAVKIFPIYKDFFIFQWSRYPYVGAIYTPNYTG